MFQNSTYSTLMERFLCGMSLKLILFEENLLLTVKHGEGSIRVWSCFSYYGVEKLVIMEGNEFCEIINILGKNLKASHSSMKL